MKNIFSLFVVINSKLIEPEVEPDVTSDIDDLLIEEKKSKILKISSNSTEQVYIFTEHKNNIIQLNCSYGSLETYDCSLDYSFSDSKIVYLNLTTNNVGVDFLRANSTNQTILRVQVIKSEALYIFNEVIGWIYFLAWTVSFYPQIILNYKRKSVEGLNFDFVLLNVIGFACYSVFNWSLYFSDEIFKIYEKEHPDGVNPVQINDLFFSLHALVASIITGIQIFFYDRAGQKIGYFGIVIGIGSVLCSIISTIPAGVGKITWLDYLTILSIVKLIITITKYMPQAYMNFKRQSTEGWSIGNVLLDLTGGSFSMLQMLLEGFNNSQFSLIFGDPTKFGLGLFSILFDLLFIVQHYCLYRENLGYVPQLDDYQDY
jgi:cystinosin